MNVSGQIHPIENEDATNYNERQVIGFHFWFYSHQSRDPEVIIRESAIRNPLAFFVPSEISSQVSSIPATSNLGSIESSLRSETPYSITSDICEL